MKALQKLRARAAYAIAPKAPSTPQARYLEDRTSKFLWGWTPALREPNEDIEAALRQSVARAIEAIQNSGWLSGALDTAVSHTVGVELKLNAAPDIESLGWDATMGSEWRRTVERRWRAWCSKPTECDAAGKMQFGQLIAQAYRSWFAYGEIVGLLPLIRRPESTTATKLQLIPPSRLQNHTHELERWHSGVRIDGNGMPIAYRFSRHISPGGAEMGDWVDVAARDSGGRMQLGHVFDGPPTSTRGITPLAPVLKVVRQYDQLADATLVTSLLQTIFAATVTTEASSDFAFDGMLTLGDANSPLSKYLQTKNTFYENSAINLGEHGRVAHLLPGEKMEFLGAEHPNRNYQDFTQWLLREMARCIGVLYESATGDYSDATYSSVRMGVSDMWAIVLYRRKHIAAKLCAIVYDAWLEEQIFNGWVPYPGGFQAFMAEKALACQAQWRGPGRPTADDLKSAKAQSVRLKNGTSTLEHEIGEMGDDWEAVIDQLERERVALEDLGFTHPFDGGAPELPTEVEVQD